MKDALNTSKDIVWQPLKSPFAAAYVAGAPLTEPFREIGDNILRSKFQYFEELNAMQRQLRTGEASTLGSVSRGMDELAKDQAEKQAKRKAKKTAADAIPKESSPKKKKEGKPKSEKTEEGEGG